MNIEPIIFFDMLITIFILSVSLVSVIVYCSHNIKKGQFNLNAKDEASKKSIDIIDEARQKAVKIIDEANSRALDVVNKANLETDSASDTFNREILRVSSDQIKQFEKATSDFTKLYSQVLQDLKSKHIEVFQDVSKDIETSANEEIKNFKDSMDKLTASSQKEVGKKIETEYQALMKEIEDYKKESIGKIDNDIYKILEKISKLVFGKALNLSEHEELVEEALIKANKEGMFK